MTPLRALVFTWRALLRRDPAIPRYRGPQGRWKVLLVGLGLAWLVGVADARGFLFLLAGLLGWTAPVEAARYSAALAARERECGGLAVLAQAVGLPRVLGLLVFLGMAGPLVEVLVFAALLARVAPSTEGVVVGVTLLAFQVLAAAVLGAVAGALASDRRQVLRQVSSAPLVLYAVGFGLLVAQGASSARGPWPAVLALPPLVLPCCAGGWDGTAWGGAVTAVALAWAALAVRRLARAGA